VTGCSLCATGSIPATHELVPAPVPEPVAEAHVVPVVARRDPAARAPLPFPSRLLPAIGVPVALFAADEPYENAIRVVRPH
jgi:hypothetical protein